MQASEGCRIVAPGPTERFGGIAVREGARSRMLSVPCDPGGVSVHRTAWKVIGSGSAGMVRAGAESWSTR